MTLRRPIPRNLARPFTVSEGLEYGMSRGRMEAADLVRPFHGIRMPRSHDTSLESRCAALSTVLRGVDSFAGPTAALLWGMPLPRRLANAKALHVSTLLPARALRRDGVVATGRTSNATTMLRGLPVLEVWETCRSLAPMMSVDEVICTIEFVVTGDLRRPALSSLEALESYLVGHDHHPGIVQLRRASAQARPGAWSPRETRLRLLLMRAGIPEPQMNVRLPLPDGRGLVPDLAWPRYRVAAEYNGGHHERSEQRVKDLRRIDDFTDIGWTTVNIEKTEFTGHPESVVLRVAQRLASRGWVAPPGFAPRLHALPRRIS